MGLQNVLAVVPGLAILALEGSKECKVLEKPEKRNTIHFHDMSRLKHNAGVTLV